MRNLFLRIFKGLPWEEHVERIKKEKTRANDNFSEVQRLRAELIGKEALMSRARAVVAANVGDVEPSEEKARREYVASASNFYQEILEPKLLQMIAEIRELEDTIFTAVPTGMSRIEYDYILKGTSNAFKLLMDWGTAMVGEHASNIIKEGPSEE